MRICIPTEDGAGPEGLLSDHFGKAPWLTFFDSEAGEWEVVRNRAGTGVHGACRPLDFLQTRPVDVVLCRGLGRRALARLREWGTEVLVTREVDAQGSVKAFRSGRLAPIAQEDTCEGHEHHHAPGAGQGRGRTFGTGFGGRPPA